MASSDYVKPTILTFHGSGSNSTIHTVQLARLSKLLKAHFEIESLEGPLPSAAGPGVLPFFEGCGPYKRWIPPADNMSASVKSGGESAPLPPQVEDLVRSTVQAITAKGGRIAGLIGFSQGTRVVAGLLKGAEIAAKLKESGVSNAMASELDWLNFPFALSVCGSWPPVLIPTCASTALKSSSLSVDEQKAIVEAKIGIPTYHVQGNADEWAWAGKLLIDNCYDVADGKSVVMEANMGHHYPVQPEDSETLKDWIMDVYLRSVDGGGKR